MTGDIKADAIEDLSGRFAAAQREAFEQGFTTGLNEAREMDGLVAWLHDQRDAAFATYKDEGGDLAERKKGEYRAYVEVLEFLTEQGVEI